MLAVAEQRRKTRVGIEGGPAQPVDRSVAADQRRRLAIADQSIVFDPAGQAAHRSDQSRPSTIRSRVAPLSAATSIAEAICSIDTRKPPPPVRMLVDGAGNIGLVDQAQRSSSEIASSRDLVRARKPATE